MASDGCKGEELTGEVTTGVRVMLISWWCGVFAMAIVLEWKKVQEGMDGVK